MTTERLSASRGARAVLAEEEKSVEDGNDEGEERGAGSLKGAGSGPNLDSAWSRWTSPEQKRSIFGTQGTDGGVQQRGHHVLCLYSPLAAAMSYRKGQQNVTLAISFIYAYMNP